MGTEFGAAAVAMEQGAGERSDSDESRILDPGANGRREEAIGEKEERREWCPSVSMVGGRAINYGGTGGNGSFLTATTRSSVKRVSTILSGTEI